MNSNVNTSVTSSSVNSPAAPRGVAAANLVLANAAGANGKEGTGTIILPPGSTAAPDTSVITLELPTNKGSRLAALESERDALAKEIAADEAAALESTRQARVARVQAIVDQSNDLTTDELKMAFLGLRDRLHDAKAKSEKSSPKGQSTTHRAPQGGVRHQVASTKAKSKHASRNAVTPADAAKMVQLYKGGINVTEIKRKMGFSRQTIYRWLQEGGVKIAA